MDRPKVFGIGLNKTGTTTLEAALRLLGYNVTGANKTYVPDIYRGRTGPALALTEEYEAFQDWPWPLLFEELFARYGTDARYILTVRESPEVWLRSQKNHMLQDRLGKVVRPKFSVYGPRYPFGFEREYLTYYNAHNARVEEFFRQQGAEHVLLKVCWETGDGWSELCSFLGSEPPEAPFPHANETARRKRRKLRAAAHRTAARLYAAWHGRHFREDVAD